jgi:DNA adenine methylase
LTRRPEFEAPEFERYVEPFFGGGALFFHLRPNEALLGDVNADLIRTYEAVRDNWKAVEQQLLLHAAKHSPEYYYAIRESRPADDPSAAARLLYLNRTCWNGLYRVNRSGQFNVPIGTKTNVIIEGELESVSEGLRRAVLRISDFADILSETGEGDFVYVDPPYTVKHNKNGFLKYNESIFTWSDQERLRDAVVGATMRGARVLVSNAAHESVRELYRSVGEILEITRASVIAGKAAARGSETELLVKCY